MQKEEFYEIDNLYEKLSKNSNEYFNAALALEYEAKNVEYTPQLFLTRHAIELRLKAIIILILTKYNNKIELNNLILHDQKGNVFNNKSVLNNHSLKLLLDFVIFLINDYGIKLKNEINDSLKFFIEKINLFDMDSTAFRYPIVKRNGKYQKPMPCKFVKFPRLGTKSEIDNYNIQSKETFYSYEIINLHDLYDICSSLNFLYQDIDNNFKV